DQLREAARDLELAARHGLPNLSDLYREVQRRADIVFRSIQSLRQVTPAEGSSGVPASAQLEPARLRVPLDRLRAALADFDHSGCTEALAEVARLNLPRDLLSQSAHLWDLIDAYEYDEAAAVVSQMLAALPEDRPL